MLQKIVFRLDAIDDALESHALLKEMRQLHSAVKASEHAELVRLFESDSSCSLTRNVRVLCGVGAHSILD